jgi:pyruvate/2-oxoglutarate dehydrogenase complex dihydrolipoamide dehydrogenase (E3) component
VEEVHEKRRLRERLDKSGVAVYDGVGEAGFVGESSLALGDGRRLEAEKFVLCAGGHARRLDILGGELALSHSDVWTMRALPGSVAVVGAATTGCQLASVLAASGVRVRLLEAAPRILGAEDESLSAGVAEAFGKRGIKIATSIDGVARIEESGGGRRLTYSRNGHESTLEVGAVIFAAGWPGNGDCLNLSGADVEVGRGGYVRDDDALRTSAPHVFAAGDLTGRMMLVQSATHEAEIAAENAVLDADRTLRHAVVPHSGASPTPSTGVLASRRRRPGESMSVPSPWHPTRTSTAES